MKKLADMLNVDTVRYERSPRAYTQKAYVTYSKSTGSMYFNVKMMKMLNIDGWANVIFGYDKRTGIVVMKECDAEEFGAVALRVPKVYPVRGKEPAPMDGARTVHAKHVMVAHDLHESAVFRAERNGVMVLLKNAKDE